MASREVWFFSLPLRATNRFMHCNTGVDTHNYREALSAVRKVDNWSVLNQKVFKRHLGFELSKAEIEGLCSGADKAAEK
jgi:hypothetical protein